MEKKKSSIEWFYQRILAKDIESVFEQAKAMHKEEMIDAYREGRSDQQSEETFYHRNSEQYYNETFGGEK